MQPDRLAEVADLAEERAKRRQEAAAAADASHHDLALAWIDAHTLGEHTPVFANGAFHVPTDGGLWRLLPIEEAQVSVARLFNGRKLCRKNSDFKQIADHAAAVCLAEDFFDSPPAGVATAAGFHRLSDGARVVCEPLQLEHRQTFRLEWAPDWDAECVLFDRVVSSAFEGDDEGAQTDLLWQLIGAALFGLMARHQLVALFLGRERSGKSLIQRLIERVFPASACSAVSPASWHHEYHVAALAGKRINIVGELDDGQPIGAAAFKNVTGQNLVAGRHPTHRPFSFRCGASHFFASNVLPPTTDRSEAFYRRWRVLRFANTVPADKVDPYLLDKIVAEEMPGVLANAFRGAERVADAGRIRGTLAHESALGRWRQAANPLQQFLTDDEWIELDPGARQHTLPEVYAAYRRWAAAAGFRNPFGRNHFIELLEATGATRGVVIVRDGTRNVAGGLRLLQTGNTD